MSVTEPTQALTARFPARRAVVTGAASGVGLEACRLLLAAGWTVAALDNDRDRLEDELGASGAHRMVCDVADATALNRAIAAFVEAAGGVDVLVTAAGIGAGGRFEQSDPDDWRRVLDVNVLGTVEACRAVLSAMCRQGSGQIVTIASAAAFHALPQVSAYNASKAAVLAFSETLSGELAGSGIGVTVKLSTFYRSRLPELTLGPERERELTRRLAERSGLSARTVAEQLLQAAGDRRLYLVTPRQARVLWAFKRHAPRAYQRLLPGLHRRLVARLDPTVQKESR